MPRYAAERVLLAPIDDVWKFVAEPYHLSDWFPGITGVQPDHRGFGEGARWRIIGPGPGRGQYARGRDSEGMLIVHTIRAPRRFVFELLRVRTLADLSLRPLDESRTEARLEVAMPWWGIFSGTVAKQALRRLYDLIQTAAEL